jgi:hypothetical protein
MIGHEQMDEYLTSFEAHFAAYVNHKNFLTLVRRSCSTFGNSTIKVPVLEG